VVNVAVAPQLLNLCAILYLHMTQVRSDHWTQMPRGLFKAYFFEFLCIMSFAKLPFFMTYVVRVN